MSNDILITEKPTQPAVPLSVPPRRFLKFGVIIFVFAFASLGLFHQTILTALATAWVVDTPVQKSDAIYVLGGGLETRPFEAARLYREGLAPLVLISNTETTRVSQIDLQPTDTNLLRSILIKQGVPENAIMAIGTENASTRDEAIALTDWHKKHPLKSIIIPTDLFHSHRVNWLFQKELSPLGVKLYVTAIKPRHYSTKDWWKNEDGLITFQNEVIKHFYYRIQY